MKTLLTAAMSAAAFLCANATAAQPATTTPVALGGIEEVVVTGRLEEDLPIELAQIGTRVNTVSGVQIRNIGAIDIAQSLQASVPGLYVSPKNGPFDYVDISLQGSRTQDVLWLVDGVRINNRLYGGTTPLDTLPSSMVEQIEVLEGSQALFYGTQGVAGAINIVTRGFSDTPDGSLTVGADTHNGRHFDGTFRDTLAGNHFVVYGSSDHSEGFKPFRDQDYQPSGTDRRRAYDVLTVGGKYAYDLTDALRFSTSYQHTDAKLDFARSARAAVAFNERNEDILSAKLDYAPSRELELFLKGYYHWWYAYFTEFDNDLANPGKLIRIDDHDFWGFTDYGVNAVAKYAPMQGLEYFVGYDYQNYTGSDVVLVITQKTEHVHALFGQIATTPDLIPNTRLAAGFRYNAPSVGPSATVWNVSGQFNISDDVFVRGMVGTSFRLPTAEELFADDPNDERGNPDLKPETSTNANASVGGALGTTFKWEAIGFYREIDNLIDLATFDDATNQDVFGNVPGKVTVHGGEFVLQAALGEAFAATLSYTHSSAKMSGSDVQLNRIPEDLFKAMLDYHPADMPFGLTASVNYVGSVHNNVSGVGRVGYGNYAVFDVGGRVFFDAMRRHRLNVNVQNAFDTHYASSVARGRTDVGNKSYLIENRGLPRTLRLSYSYAF